MNWKQITITALVTLLVTIISGIIVNSYTKRNLGEDKENLVYEISRNSRFQSDSLQLSLITIQISNIGEKFASNVKIIVDLGKESQIIDVENQLKRTGEQFVYSEKNKKLLYTIDKLFPKDNFQIDIALKNSIPDPKVSVESDQSIGKIKTDIITQEDPKFLTQLLIFLGLTITLLIPTLFILKKFSKYIKNPNNTAFLFIHNGQTEFGEKIIRDNILRNGASSYELANLALAKCLNHKDNKEYLALLRMADFACRTKEGRMVNSFNRLIIAGFNQDYSMVQNEFAKCVKMGKKSFKRYYYYSSILKDLIKDDYKLKSTLEDLEKTHFA